jgi:hypothetical protein
MWPGVWYLVLLTAAALWRHTCQALVLRTVLLLLSTASAVLSSWLAVVVWQPSRLVYTSLP